MFLMKHSNCALPIFSFTKPYKTKLLLILQTTKKSYLTKKSKKFLMKHSVEKTFSIFPPATNLKFYLYIFQKCFS